MKFQATTILLTGLLLAGCAGSISPTIKGSAQETFKTKGILASGWGQDGMVILPVSGFSSDLRQASSAIYDAASSERRDIRPALASEASSRDLSNEGLAALAKSSNSRYVLKPAVTSSTSDRFTIVDISARLIDSRTGEVVWEGTAQGKGSHTITSLFGYHNLSVNKKTLVQEAARQLAVSLPR